MVHLFAVRQTEALLGIKALRLHLEHLDHLNGALKIFILRDALVGELPARQECLHHQVLDRNFRPHCHKCSLFLPGGMPGVCFR